MREIKFQCIYRPTKEKFKPSKIDLINGNVFGNFDGELYDYCYFSLTPNGYGDAWLRQYTGLHDNTKWDELTNQEQQEWLETGKTKEEWEGKEIYEGDILKSQHGQIGRIQWDESRLTYVVTWSAETSKFGEEYDSYLIRAIYKSKVIGNIYENPDLLGVSECER
ncbi:hypothetical protein JIMMER1_82 [Brevibacillus phage Jimmer1]|uniref:YopX protein domain-containing protein n=5 Tax=Caudoviricetes TaxID=2731619 RepID=S5MCJ0_9CAUD|nr:hypothetical protein DAVIES_74 [Brevibacillus phage Davies]YP_009215096.1 hypothetical protein AVV10_gp082 [Brevibacillus phage Osiris]YP_009226392.1 hypothetical protein AXJ21_gp082 [Brevibacillus phage Jimmer1]YP_009606509.1 hypothetical protein FDI01_gp082 [Brevibacillus phage Jimmer2]ALA48092.1 hypothetical protein POWDER_82 [Brevibacillus phage Powder]AGR47215.1 hypothetical protein JIMMER2_82 [Brevibacillus phage Jimmer2]AGR47316.1 hypothetical protein JIMMER1_82 [Brevibacillus phage